MTPDDDDDIPPDLAAWGLQTYRAVLRQEWRDLRAEYFHLFPSPEMKELLQIVADQRMDESEALLTLLRAAQDPPREATTALAIAVASPWAGDRVLVVDRPKRPAPDYRTFGAYLDRMPAPAGAPLPTDRGPLAFAAYHRVLRPLATLGGTLPNWLTDPALQGGYIAPPPREPAISGDGRLLALNMLVHAIPPADRDDPGTRLALLILTEWFVGGRAAILTPGLSLQHPVMRWDPREQMAWLAANNSVGGGSHTRAKVELARPIPPTWTRPPMTTQELQDAQIRADNARRREAAREYAAARQQGVARAR